MGVGVAAQGGRALAGIDSREGPVVPHEHSAKREYQLRKQAEARARQLPAGLGLEMVSQALIFLIFTDQRISKLEST